MVKMFIAWISLIPLVVWNNQYEVPKVFIFLLGSIFVLLSVVFSKKKLMLTKRDCWYLAWLSTLLISGFFGEDFKASLLGGSYRHQGVVFFLGLWLVIKVVERLSTKDKRLLYKAIAVTVIIESLIVILGRRLGTIGEINAVSGFLAIGTYFVFSSFRNITMLFPIVSFLTNFSKSALISFIPYLLNKSKASIVFVSLGIVLLFVLKPINNSSIFENRQVIWWHALDLIIERPLLGYGPESNELIFKRKFYESGFPLSSLIIDRSHNLFMDLTLWSGIPGLILFLVFLKKSVVMLDDTKRKVLYSFLIFSMFQPISIVHWLLFTLLV